MIIHGGMIISVDVSHMYSSSSRGGNSLIGQAKVPVLLLNPQERL